MMCMLARTVSIREIASLVYWGAASESCISSSNGWASNPIDPTAPVKRPDALRWRRRA